jgi:hypothetical protein
MIAMDIALFVIGVLLLQRRSAGRIGAIAWAVAALVVLVGRAAAFEIVLWPRLRGFYDGMRAGPGAGAGAFWSSDAFVRTGTYAPLLFMAIFPVCLLVGMSLRSSKEAVQRAVE